MTTTTAVTSGTTATATAPKTMSTDFNMFLKLLTTQMQNQDPLKPMDSTEYTAQLAQYTQVEQTVKQTGVLGDILARLGTQDMTQASNLIGRTVQIDSAVAGLSADAPARWAIGLDGAANATATIKDETGRTVATRALEADATDLAWNGKLDAGGTAPAGAYTLSIVATDTAGVGRSPTIRSTGAVRDVETANGVVTLGINGMRLPLARLVKLAG